MPVVNLVQAVANMNQKLQKTIQKALELPINDSRLPALQELIQYIQGQFNQRKSINLNFICTHNSRRSQFSQIWAKTAAVYYDIPAFCFSGGVEVTAFNERAVDSCRRLGFEVKPESKGKNTVYRVLIDEFNSIRAFSKVFDHIDNPQENFAAIMTCSQADENCPFIPGADARIPLRYEDPKVFDNTEVERDKYDERSLQIASELLYVFQQLASDQRNENSEF